MTDRDSTFRLGDVWMNYYIRACSGKRIDIKRGQKITVIDLEGGQVADFFAVSAADSGEFLSPAATLDCHESLKLNIGDALYTNLYQPMFRIIADDVGTHDLLFPSCRPEMYHFFYQNGDGHPNCFDNINRALGEHRPIINPVNLFMYTTVDASGKITIHPPDSKAGDKIVLEALMDARVGIAACSVAECDTNSGKCTPIMVCVE